MRPGTITRRRFLVGAGAVGVSATGLGLVVGCGRLPWQAEAPAKVPRLGILSQGRADTTTMLEPFQQGLREHGLVEGENLLIEYRWGGGGAERLPELAAELVNAKVDVIATVGTSAAHAAKSVTSTIPIVTTGASDPVRMGLVATLARPGGNLTGLSLDAGPGIMGKRLELLRAVAPGASRLAILWSPAESGLEERFADARDAGRALGVEVQSVPVGGPEQFEDAFDVIVRERAGAIGMVGGPFFYAHRTRIADLALRHRLPTIQNRREYVQAGMLMAYGPSFSDTARRAAVYVDKILKGANPGDLPVEQPMTFEFIVNIKTAQALGITFPNEIMLQVTEVLQ